MCPVCRRGAWGFGFAPPGDKQRRRWRFCSMAHLTRAYDHWKRTGTMIDPSPAEDSAKHEGMRNAGEFLDSIGKTDLATLTGEEWGELFTCFLRGYTEALAESRL